MAKFRIELHELFKTIVEVEADNVDEAKAKVEDMCWGNEIGAWKDPASPNIYDFEIREAE